MTFKWLFQLIKNYFKGLIKMIAKVIDDNNHTLLSRCNIDIIEENAKF